MINFYRYRLRYVNIIKLIEEQLGAMMKTDEDEVAQSIKYMKRLTVMFWISALITANMMCLNSAVQALLYQPEEGSAPPALILRSWFPFDDYWRYFWVMYLVQYYIMNIGMLIVPCWHAFIVSIMVFVIAKLRILNNELSRMSSEAELVKCVKERENLHNFVQELSSLINSSVFLDFIVFSVLLCALLFQATQVNLFTLIYPTSRHLNS